MIAQHLILGIVDLLHQSVDKLVAKGVKLLLLQRVVGIKAGVYKNEVLQVEAVKVRAVFGRIGAVYIRVDDLLEAIL